MKAVILAGGLGTRLRPYTFCIPKPLLPFGEKPVLQVIVEHLRGFGIDEIILATGYQAELIHAFCGDGSRFGVNVSYVHESMPSGTAGPLALVRDMIAPDESFILMNGDIITTLDFGCMLEFSRAHDFDLTVGYTHFVYQSPYGVLTVDGDSIAGIVEKPSVEYSISGGVYVLKASTLEFVPDHTYFTIPQLIETLIGAGRRVGGYHIKEYWIGLERVENFNEALAELGRETVESPGPVPGLSEPRLAPARPLG